MIKNDNAVMEVAEKLWLIRAFVSDGAQSNRMMHELLLVIDLF